MTDPIKLDESAGAVLFEPKDWQVCPKHRGMMHHLPSGSDYYVGLPEEFQKSSKVSLFDFHCWPRDVDPTQSPAEVIAQGRAAIAVFLIENRIWNPVITKVPDPPKPCRKVRGFKRDLR